MVDEVVAKCKFKSTFDLAGTGKLSTKEAYRLLDKMRSEE